MLAAPPQHQAAGWGPTPQDLCPTVCWYHLMWDSQPLHSPARFTHAKKQTLRHLLEGKPPQSTQAGHLWGLHALHGHSSHTASTGQQGMCGQGAVQPYKAGGTEELCASKCLQHTCKPPGNLTYGKLSPHLSRELVWDLLQSSQPKVCHDVHNVCHGRSSQAATISSLVKHWNRLPGKRWNPHLWNYLRDVWTGH